MMDVLNFSLGLLVTILFVGVIVGLIKPSSLKWLHPKQATPTRLQILGFGGLAYLVLLILILIVTPSPSGNSTTTQEKAPEINKPVESSTAAPAPISVPEPVKATPPLKVDTPATPVAEPAPPVKPEPSLGLTPEEFREKFNERIRVLNLDGLKPIKKKFTIEQHEGTSTFKAELSKAVGLIGFVNNDGKLSQLIFILGKTDRGEIEAMNMLLAATSAGRVFNPDLPKETVGQAVLDLMGKASKGVESDDNLHSKVFGNVRYSALASTYTGIWFTFESKDAEKNNE